MFEPQDKIFNFIKDKYKNNENVKIFNKSIVIEKKETLYFHFNKHDLTTSSLSTLDKNNSYLKLKAKLFGTDTDGMITQKRDKIEALTPSLQ